MMKKKFIIKKVIACTLVTIMIMAQGLTVLAEDTAGISSDGKVIPAPFAGDVPEAGTDAEDILDAEEPGEVNSEDEAITEETSEMESSTEETSEEESISSEEVSEKDSEDISEEEVMSEEESDGEELSEENEETEELVLFPGLDASHVLSSQDMAEKREVAAYSKDWENAEAGVDFAEEQLIFLADTEEEAQAYAKAYNAELISFRYGIAVIQLNANSVYGNATVLDAMQAASADDNRFPAVWPNYIRHKCDDIPEEEPEGDASLMANPYLSAKSDYYQWYHSVVNSTVAFAQGYTGKGVTVAVIDSGARTDHEDLKGMIAIEVTPKLGTDPQPDEDHGANVAGIIGARDNIAGGRGIAPDAGLLTLRVMDDEGIAYDSDIMTAIKLAVNNGADIINMSLGGANYNPLVDDTVTDAYNAGVAVFCAAGNEHSETVIYPAGYKNSYSVAALNYSLEKTDFSNYGSKVKYSAPGYVMWSCSNKAATGTAAYCDMSGTSQATPVISGCAAVLLSSGRVTGTGSQRVDNLMKLMDKGCVKVSGSGMGKGYVDLAKALDLTKREAAPFKPEFQTKSGTTFYEEEQTIYLKNFEKGCTAYYSTDGKAVTYKNGVLSANASTYSPSKGIIIKGAASVTVNAIIIKDSNRLASSNVSAKYYLKPLMSNLSIEPKNDIPALNPGKKLTMKATILPQYTANKKLKWSVSPEGQGVSINSSGVVSATSKAEEGNYCVSAVAQDGSGVKAEYKIFVFKPEAKITLVSAKTSKIVLLKGNNKEKYVDDYLQNIKITVKANGNTKTYTETIGNLYWTSADNNIVSVDGETGAIYNIKNTGSTKLYGTAMDGSGKKLVVDISIVEPGLEISGLTAVSQGKSITLKTEIPKNGSKGKINWEVSPAGKGVMVSSGRVTAKTNAEVGTYTVTASTTDGTEQKKSIQIQVTKDTSGVNSISATNPENNTKAGTINLFRVTNEYGALTEKSVTVDCKTKAGTASDYWDVSCSNPSLVRVVKNGGTVKISSTAKAVGTATVTVFSTDGTNKKATFKVCVTNPATKLLISPPNGRSKYVAYGKKLNLKTSFEERYGKIDASAKKLEWTSSDEKILKVDKKTGVVTGLSTSRVSVTITARTTDGSNLTATFICRSCDRTNQLYLFHYDDKDELQLARNITINQGASKTIIIYPIKSDKNSGESDPYYSYKISREGLGIAYRSSEIMSDLSYMYLKANRPGNYKVTVSCSDGSTATVTLNVKVK